MVQPFDNKGNIERFHFELSGSYTTHWMIWYPNSIVFTSNHGHYVNPQGGDVLINTWAYLGNDIPPEDNDLRVHLNLWLYQGNPSIDNQPTRDSS